MATFYKGFVYESDVAGHDLLIEGVPVAVPEGTTSRDAVARRYIIDRLLKERDRKRKEHLAVLNEGMEVWNSWRQREPSVRPTLGYARPGEIIRTDLRGCDFSYTNLCEAHLRELHLEGASFHQAILAGADLSGAHLEGANFCRTDLYGTNLTGAWLNGANLQGVQLAKTRLAGAHLSDCTVYGLAAWDLRDEPADQRRLKIRYTPITSGNRRSRAGSARDEEEDTVEVDGVDLASFMYLTLNNRNISRIIDAAGSAWVLILGRFTGEGREVVETVKATVRAKNGIPIVFDFPRPERRDLIETLLLLAGMSAFVVVDLTRPRSTPLEVQAIVPNFGVPVVPLIKSGAHLPTMFAGLKKYPWVRAAIPYSDSDQLSEQLGIWIDRHRAEESARLQSWDAAAATIDVRGVAST